MRSNGAVGMERCSEAQISEIRKLTMPRALFLIRMSKGQYGPFRSRRAANLQSDRQAGF